MSKSYILQFEKKSVGGMVFAQTCVLYTAVYSVKYLNDQMKIVLSQNHLAKLSLRVIVNNLNEAIFLRSNDGSLSYCNNPAI